MTIDQKSGRTFKTSLKSLTQPDTDSLQNYCLLVEHLNRVSSEWFFLHEVIFFLSPILKISKTEQTVNRNWEGHLNLQWNPWRNPIWTVCKMIVSLKPYLCMKWEFCLSPFPKIGKTEQTVTRNWEGHLKLQWNPWHNPIWTVCKSDRLLVKHLNRVSLLWIWFLHEERILSQPLSQNKYYLKTEQKSGRTFKTWHNPIPTVYQMIACLFSEDYDIKASGP